MMQTQQYAADTAECDELMLKKKPYHSSHLEHMIMKASGLYGSSQTQYLRIVVHSSK
jgi:hypothetical protein